MQESRLIPLVEPLLAQFDLELEALDVVPAGKRRVLRIVVDGDGPEGTGPLLDDIATATKAISAALDDDDVTGSSPYTLEVSSRGVARPLTKPAHWRRNTGRLVTVTDADGAAVTGRIISSDDESVVLEVEESTRTLRYPDIAKALIQVELNRKSADIEED